MSNDDAQSSLEIMEARMLELESLLVSPSLAKPAPSTRDASSMEASDAGWQLVEETKWRPCPIGAVFPLTGKLKGSSTPMGSKMGILDLISAL